MRIRVCYNHEENTLNILNFLSLFPNGKFTKNANITKDYHWCEILYDLHFHLIKYVNINEKYEFI